MSKQEKTGNEILTLSLHKGELSYLKVPFPCISQLVLCYFQTCNKHPQKAEGEEERNGKLIMFYKEHSIMIIDPENLVKLELSHF